MALVNPVHGELGSGSLLSWSRRYTEQDIAAFDALSGRVLPVDGAEFLPDLLVVAPLTKLGGDLDYLARKMVWTHARAVRVDEELTAELEILGLEEAEGFHKINFAARVRSDKGDVVLDGTSKGMILRVPGAAGEAAGETAGAGEPGAPAGHQPRAAADPAVLDEVADGAVLRNQVTVGEGDIDLCAMLTGDRGAHHAVGLEGRRMAQGLLTATTVPLIRGDGHFHCRSMSMVFLAPVFAGDTAASEVRVAAGPEPETFTLNTSVRGTDGTELLVSESTGAFGTSL
ncbi:hypothetical protein [Streptomyces sp. NPDC058045]|uniref:hypothetical protein n=1 Tax=Streptomyces sp. NPDC058045 TaxID=3346311 RepID=UPI0036E1E8BC